MKPPISPDKSEERSSSLGPVPDRPEPAVSRSHAVTVPVYSPTPAVQSGKGLVVGLGVAAAVMTAVSGWGLVSKSGLKASLDETAVQKERAEQSAETSSKNLEKLKNEIEEAKKDHQLQLQTKESEVAKAKEDAKTAADELEQATAKAKSLQSQLDDVTEKIGNFEKLEAEMASLKAQNNDLAQAKAAAEADARRNSEALANRAPQAPRVQDVERRLLDLTSPTQRSTPPKEDDSDNAKHEAPKRAILAWVRLGKHENGRNKGRWYFVAPDGFKSPLFTSQEEAIRQAELRAGCKQPPIGVVPEVRVVLYDK